MGSQCPVGERPGGDCEDHEETRGGADSSGEGIIGLHRQAGINLFAFRQFGAIIVKPSRWLVRFTFPLWLLLFAIPLAAQHGSRAAEIEATRDEKAKSLTPDDPSRA